MGDIVMLIGKIIENSQYATFLREFASVHEEIAVETRGSFSQGFNSVLQGES